ncbi:protein trichome birefringence-like 14 isoform X1 [Elaeis guineensis]|uniref:Protein trichome birefringence-like 14 isoform X1 n=1 Tax=Elaeis guineensis var. tenera TaxID=51953 RepID=A0A8N4FBA5_ELAGV|nr:protein trichome birefringence-like 14 isoform X1 [Elaeis guineensis]
MKGGNLHKLRGNRLSLSLLALLCTTLIVWAWEKTPSLSTFLPPREQFDIFSPATVVPARTPVTISENKIETPSAKEDLSAVGRPVNALPNEAGKVVVIPQSDSSMRTSSEKEDKGKGSKNMPVEKKECNYAKGKWVADKRRPLYSGFGCKQWLSQMWACRLMQRTDFAYEGFRWQPQGCDMPEFKGSEFLRRMQHKTIALVGDSLGRQQFQSLMCMVTGGNYSPEALDVGKEYGLVKAPGAIRPDGWAYRFPSTNTTILYYWSASLCELEPLNRSDPATHYAMHLDRPAIFLKQYLHRFDVLVLNTGHHWNRGKFTANRWEMYVGGKPNTDRKIAQIWNARNLTIYSVIKWLDAQLPQHRQLKAFFRTISPRHFVNGDWNTGGSCDNTIPLAGGSEVLQDGSNDTVVEGAVGGTRVKLLDITALSQLRDEGHISKYTNKALAGVHDCLHWCLPGIPDTWNEILYAQL